MCQDIRLSLERLPSVRQLERVWRQLEAAGTPSFFTGWGWIGCWLDTLPERARPFLLQAQRDGRTVGLGLVGRRVARRARVIPSRSLYLNATGDPLLDEITIAHNGMLTDRGSEFEVIQATLDVLCKRRGWDEWIWPAVDDSESLLRARLSRCRVVVEERRCCHYVDLDVIRQSSRDYLDCLGPNTRYSIRRSIREFGKLGPLTIESAQSTDEAQLFLAQLARLHQAYWTSRGKSGSFANSFFAEFHRRLVETNFPLGRVQLLQIKAGSVSLGYLYNFIHGRRVLNYQGGFNYALRDKHCRPGLVAHAMAVKFNLELGYAVYDFLAGDDRYKRAMSTAATSMSWLTVRRDRVRFEFEDWLRRRLAKHRPALL